MRWPCTASRASLTTLPAGTWNLVVERGSDTPTVLAFDLYVAFDEP